MLAGEFRIELDGQEHILKKGDILPVEREVRHIIRAAQDGVLEEVSTTHYPDDSYYDDESIMTVKNRRTNFSYWV